MYKNYLKNSAKLFAVIALPVALALTGCVEDKLQSDVNVPDDVTPSIPSEEVTPLSRASLAIIPSSESRINYAPVSRAEKGQLRLYASIENPSKEGKITGFVKEGRYLSATCVFYNDLDNKYYVTYHMQGNNYGTEQKDETSGCFETFSLNEDDEGKTVVDIENLYMSEDPSKLDFDFNHLYFDNIQEHANVTSSVKDNRIILVGHKSEPVKTGVGTNTAAIIAKLNLDGSPFIDYKVVYTGDNILDERGKSLGKENAQDVNCVVRNYDTYVLATRKGIALLRADDENLFNPRYDRNENIYFIKTPGSVKYVSKSGGYNFLNFLYLTDDFPDNFNYESSLYARMIQYYTHNPNGQLLLAGGYTDSDLIKDVKNDDFLSKTIMSFDFPQMVSPVDGKNVLYTFPNSGSEFYAALGKGGLYYKGEFDYSTQLTREGIIEFDGRPVNGVFVDDKGDYISEKGYNNGFIYVANGSKLTIIHKNTLEEVTSYNLPSEEIGSANYIYVTRDPVTYERTITVAFGQAGVKIFKFTPEYM